MSVFKSTPLGEHKFPITIDMSDLREKAKRKSKQFDIMHSIGKSDIVITMTLNDFTSMIEAGYNLDSLRIIDMKSLQDIDSKKEY